MSKKKIEKTVPDSNKTLMEDSLKFIEYTAAEDGWFDDYTRGWALLNRLRDSVGRPKITPVNEPTGDYFASDGAQK